MAFELQSGREVALCDSEAGAGVAAGAVTIVDDLTARLARYAGQTLGGRRLLVPFIGGQGDAVVLASCLNGLSVRNDDLRIDVACPPVVQAILQIVDARLNIVTYPPTVDGLSAYDYFTTLEGLDDLPRVTGESNLALFARRMCMAPPDEPVGLSVPDAVRAVCRLPESNIPRVGLALTHSTHMRAYPIDHTLQLARGLIERGMAVFLFGVGQEVGTVLPDAPPRLCNMIDKTPDISALSAMLDQMTAVVTPDSLFLHLAGALRRPTIGLFTATDPAVAGGYPTVLALTAHEGCNPCGATGNHCPEGHGQCIVPRNAALQPDRIVDRVQAVVEAAVGQYH